MALEDRLVAALQAIGLDMKQVQGLAAARTLPVKTAAGVVQVPLSVSGGLPVKLASGAVSTVPLGV